MFTWYRQSEICYAYLCDVHLNNSTWQEWESVNSRSDKQEQGRFFHQNHEFAGEFMAEFCGSVWFTRGWTLQELLASKSIVFFGHYWQTLGTKDFLQAPISYVTYLSTSILTRNTALDAISVVERMSWAAKRVTTRIEDRAYSLIGIFGVNMSMLYGEGEGAFRRLQEEILKRSNDQSILLSESCEMNVLATSPADFGIHLPVRADVSTCKFHPFGDLDLNLSEAISYSSHETDATIALTSAGISLSIYLVPWFLDTYLVPLEVTRMTRYGNSGSYEVAHIFLKHQLHDTRYHRICFYGEWITYLSEQVSWELITRAFGSGHDMDMDENPPKRQCVIAYKDLTRIQNTSLANVLVDSDFYGIRFTFEANRCWGPDGNPRSCDVIARREWSPVESKLEFAVGSWGVLAIFRIWQPSGIPLYFFVGFDRAFYPCFAPKTEFGGLNFDEVAADSVIAMQILDEWKFEGDNGREFIFRGSRNTYMEAECDAMVPGLQLKITRIDGYLFEFKNSRQ